VHPYLTLGGEKLSKSTQNTVDPVRVVADFGTDALRWWFARDVATVADTDFTTERLVARANEDLANGLGNLINRIVSLVHRHRGGRVPAVEVEPIHAVRGLEEAILASITDFDLRSAAGLINDAVAALNRDLETTKPWQVTKETADGQTGATLDSLLARYVQSARIIACAAEPIVPDLSNRLRDQLGKADRLPDPEPAFARIDTT
jgi:methionyl-tRNA synthetase